VADRYIVLALSDLQRLLMLLFVDMLLRRCRRLAAAFALISLQESLVSLGVQWRKLVILLAMQCSEKLS
jgi:hypothetical protein